MVQDISKLSNMKQLETLLNEIEQICPVLSSGAAQVASSSQGLAQGATEQATAVEQLSASVTMISGQIRDNADEVRNLAAKSADAAKNTAALIEDSVSSISDGVRLAEVAGKELRNAVQNVILTTELISQITKATGEQAMAMSQVSTGMDQISSLVQANSATSEETAPPLRSFSHRRIYFGN